MTQLFKSDEILYFPPIVHVKTCGGKVNCLTIAVGKGLLSLAKDYCRGQMVNSEARYPPPDWWLTS